MSRKKKDENDIEKIQKPKSIGPFDIINLMFTNKVEFDKLSNSILSKNFFMINRIFSIQFPLQAECFNKLNIDTANVIRSWQTFATANLGYGKVPFFVYTKGSKKTNEDNIQELFTKEEKQDYCNFYNITLKEFEDINYFYHDMLVNHVKNYQNIINKSEQNKLIAKIK